jgi:hypothetical protein
LKILEGIQYRIIVVQDNLKAPKPQNPKTPIFGKDNLLDNRKYRT